MNKEHPLRKVLFFCAKFLVLITILGVIWWKLLPVYGYVLVQISGGLLKFVLAVPIESGHIDAAGVLNTESKLVLLQASGPPRSMDLALLITNIPPYIALVLATAGLGLWRRLRILAYGCGILMFGHIVFIVVIFRFQEALKGASEVPTATIQFFLTLPFLLWIVFAYWDRIAAYLSAEEKAASNQDSNAAPEE